MKNNELKTVIFIGRSGCGKGTQAGLVVEKLREDGLAPVLYLETGERFRQFIAGESFSSKRSQEVMATGDLQPSFLSTWMWANELIENMTGGEHLVIDGSPRTLGEALTLASALDFYGRQEVVVVHLNVSRDWSKARLLDRGRVDDLESGKIDKRLDWFEAQVAPAIEFFKNDGRFNFLDIDGEREIAVIAEDIMSRL